MCGVTVSGLTVGTIDAGVGDLGRVSAVAADDADDGRAQVFGVLQRAHEVRADVLFEAAAADREDEDPILGAQPAARSHAANTVSQPSSLVRAVSSDTLSVGVYASKPASLRKSLTACEQLPALPPTPRKNSRPPRARTRGEVFDHPFDRVGVEATR